MHDHLESDPKTYGVIRDDARIIGILPTPVLPFDDSTVQTVLTLGPKVTASVLFPPNPLGPFRPTLVKRQDRHEDGSVSTTYYFELTEDQYRALGGE